MVLMILAMLLLLVMMINEFRHTSWIQLGSWVWNLFQVLVLFFFSLAGFS